MCSFCCEYPLTTETHDARNCPKKLTGLKPVEFLKLSLVAHWSQTVRQHVRDAIGQACASTSSFFRARAEQLKRCPVISSCKSGVSVDPTTAMAAFYSFDHVGAISRRWEDKIVTITTHDGSNYKNGHDQFHGTLIRDMSLIGHSQTLNTVVPVSILEMGESSHIFHDHFGAGVLCTLCICVHVMLA